MGSNIDKVLEKQNEIGQRLDKIDETIKSPQYQLAELQKIKNTIDILKINHEEEIKRLEMGSKEEIAKHSTKIQQLQTENKNLAEYKQKVDTVLNKASMLLTEKDNVIDKLQGEIKELKRKAPTSLVDILEAQKSTMENLQKLANQPAEAFERWKRLKDFLGKQP